MCGIIACRGIDAGSMTLDGLSHLEYRGYDSAGIAVIGDGGHIATVRAIGKLANLVDGVAADPRVLSPAGELAIGHTRWATHGAVTVDNAHPVGDCTDRVVVVHNGVLENADELRAELSLAGHRFRADVDSEVIAHLVEGALENGSGPFDALRKTVARLQGSWAVAVLVEGFDALLLARQGSPLLVRGDERRFVVASDAAATVGVAGALRSLDDGDVAELGTRWRWTGARSGGVLPPVLDDTTGSAPLARPQVAAAGAGAMAAEISEQSALAGSLVEQVLTEATRPDAWDRLGVPVPERVLFLGCGTSLHAAQVIARMLWSVAGIPAEVVVASEYDPQFVRHADLTVAISQSGETADLLSALELVPGPLVAITNSVWSSLARRADAVLDCHAGQERGVAATKSFTAQVVLGVGLALAAATAAGRSACARQLHVPLRRLAADLDRADSLSRDAAAELAAELADATGWLFLGNGSALPYAAEGALKLKEVTYRWAQCYPAGELKHGPLALVESGTPVVVVDNGSSRLATSVAEVRSRGARVIRVGGAHSQLGPDRTVDDPPWGPLTSVPPLQHLARELGQALGRDVDRPRNLAKSVTVN